MSVIKLIKERKSVRSYTGESLSSVHREGINKYIQQLKAPFGVNARIELIQSQTGDQPVKLGTYGIISGATDFLVLIKKEGPLSDTGAGYMFEQLILYCTELGLGTCWLGGTINRKDFRKQLALEPDESLVIISPVGYKREKRTFLDSLMRAGARSDKRKPFGTLFFRDAFDVPLQETETDDYRIPLEMVRLAPSASNKQPWRVIMKDGLFHFFQQSGHFSANDIGIALCHFELSCNELKLKGKYETLTSGIITPNGTKYVISWVPE